MTKEELLKSVAKRSKQYEKDIESVNDLFKVLSMLMEVSIFFFAITIIGIPFALFIYFTAYKKLLMTKMLIRRFINSSEDLADIKDYLLYGEDKID